MIPFPGESVLIQDAADVTGSPDGSLWEDIVWRAGSRTLASGSEWRAFVYPGDVDYLEETGLDCTVAWVLEVLSGTVTVAAVEGLDPTFVDYGATLGTSLGSHTITGPGSLVIPSTFTADDVLDAAGVLQLGITATSGSVDVQQIKLRVWPAAGVAGAWVTRPGWESTPQIAGVRRADVTRYAAHVTGDYESSWDATVADVASQSGVAAGPHDFVGLAPTGSGPSAHVVGEEASWAVTQSYLGGTDYHTNATLAADIWLVEGSDWTGFGHIDPALVDGVDYTRPPTEVRDEDESYIAPQLGSGSVAWDNAGAVIVQSPRFVPQGDVTVATDSTETLTIVGSGSTVTVTVNLIDAGTALPEPSVAGEQTPVTMPSDARWLLLHVSHTAALNPPEWPGTPGVNIGVDWETHLGVGDPTTEAFAPITTWASMPPFQVWNPEAVPTETAYPMRLMQRGDGLGMGSGRVFGAATRQGSNRVYGTY